MKKYLLFILIAVASSTACSQTATTHEKITREADYSIEFGDTSGALPLHVKCEYDDSKTDDAFYSIFLGKEKKDQADFTLNKQLSFDVFEEKFTTKCKSIFPKRKSPKMISLYKVYQLIWSIKNTTGDAPEAGILQFSRGLLLFNVQNNEKAINRLTYIQRRERSDTTSNSIIDIEASARNSQDSLETELKNDAANLGQKIDLFTEMLTVKRPGEDRREKDFIPIIFILDSLKYKYYFTRYSRECIAILKDTSSVSDTKYNAKYSACLSELLRVLKSHKGKISKALGNGIKQIPDLVYYTRTNPDFNENEKKDTSSPNFNEIYKRLADKRDTAYSKKDSIAQLYETKKIELTKGAPVYKKINKIELQFERGFIEAVKVWLSIGSSEYIFESIYAVGFSSVNNYRRIADTRLYVRNGKRDNDGWYIYLSDIFRNYDNRLNNFTRDYSPADTAFTIIPAETPEIVLRKEKYINIIDAKMYVDLRGIHKNNPEGLVQIEVSKRFNINTARVQAGKARSDFGFFNYLDIFGSLTKIEQNNRDLVLKNANVRDVNNNLISPYYATNLDFMRYQNHSIGVNVGMMLFDKPDYKFTAYLDFGLKYGHTSISDTVLLPSGEPIEPFAKKLDAYFLIFQFPKISIEFFPESRITPKLSWQLNNTNLYSNNQYKQVMSYEKSDVTTFFPLEKKAKLSNQYEISVKIAPDKNRSSNLFMRWRFYTQFGDANTSFSQLQVGYAYNWTIAR
ncbi:hypothetical protein [Foetidibacter luteolus]|uniref:hypothetical protein n=1 Tax=Foetidibacter luteolus TaxID=2608880 RepID=UPI00129B24AD|nr:hypothetical protein [Foetidibacter luteolus]